MIPDFFSYITEAVSSNPNIKFGSWANDGTVTVYLKGVRHTFLINPSLHHKWKTHSKHNPALVMSQISQLVRTGQATQLEPPSVTNRHPQPNTPKPTFNKQPTLFDEID